MGTSVRQVSRCIHRQEAGNGERWFPALAPLCPALTHPMRWWHSVLPCPTHRMTFPSWVKPFWELPHPEMCLLRDSKSSQVATEDQPRRYLKCIAILMLWGLENVTEDSGLEMMAPPHCSPQRWRYHCILVRAGQGEMAAFLVAVVSPRPSDRHTVIWAVRLPPSALFLPVPSPPICPSGSPVFFEEKDVGCSTVFSTRSTIIRSSCTTCLVFNVSQFIFYNGDGVCPLCYFNV